MNEINHIARAKSLIDNFHASPTEQAKLDTLKQLKIMMLHFQTLPPSNLPINIDEFNMARHILEIEMETYIKKQDGKNFELAYQKIKQFYFDFK
jgi:hypothetical protein